MRRTLICYDNPILSLLIGRLIFSHLFLE